MSTQETFRSRAALVAMGAALGVIQVLLTTYLHSRTQRDQSMTVGGTKAEQELNLIGNQCLVDIAGLNERLESPRARILEAAPPKAR